MKSKIFICLIFIITISMVVNTASATMNVIVITDPTGQDPNGAAAGSQSWQKNMFQSTFILSKNQNFAVLSGGEGNETPRLGAIVTAINSLKNGATAAQAASTANGFSGIRIIVGGPKIGAAVGGYFDAYVVVVDANNTITITPYNGGLAVLPPGSRGAIIHLLNTPGNPQYGTADAVRLQTAELMGRMIRDGYPATDVVAAAFQNVAVNAGEKHGGGALNLASGITTGDMFTPTELNETGFPMDQPYSKVCPVDGWSISFPEADNYETCPLDGTPLKTLSATEALNNAITVTGNTTSVSSYGSDAPGISDTTQEIVDASVKKHGFSAIEIAKDINSAISSGLLVGVNNVEASDININQNQKAVGVYYKPLGNNRSSPPWNLPISSSILDILGNIQTAIGLILVILVLFRSTLISSFLKKK
ncbi:hypothetical protein [Methanobacterium spitsbergense]|uniref:Uncharacterized protein n=1 Tax=Methanobacterium spitsbergense TaxID=2874285 RepID=A0A8T5UY00_9EURY|nr:hypothetical protein [Methanobacterium spitsbergense]MBZ2165589.1 hypothetical protein [Methanobacterium spitsbergense]